MSKKPSSKKSKVDAQKGNKQESLPEGVTPEPQDEEHMHLKLIADNKALVKFYLPVSDDDGQLLGDMELESQVKAFCDQYGNASTIDKPDEVLEEAKKLAARYTLKINVVENSLRATINKYRIRQGILFNIIKELVRKSKLNWIDWFKENFDARELRSLQDYMKLARIKNIIRYALFGKERLLQIERQLDDGQKELDDPISAFLEENGIDFNPEHETDDQKLRFETDIAINRQKLNGEGLEDITDEVVNDIAEKGIYLTNGHLRNFNLLKDSGEDLSEYISKLIDTGGKPKPIETPDSKAKRFKNTVDRFLNQADSALNDVQYLGELNLEIIQRITEKIRQIEQKLESLNN